MIRPLAFVVMVAAVLSAPATLFILVSGLLAIMETYGKPFGLVAAALFGVNAFGIALLIDSREYRGRKQTEAPPDWR